MRSFLYLQLWAAAAAGQMESLKGATRAWVSALIYQAGQVGALLLVLGAVPSIVGWTRHQVAVLFALRLLAHAVSQLFFSQLQRVGRAVETSEIDTYLLRPLPLLPQILLRRFDATSVADLGVGLIVLIVALVSYPARLEPFSYVWIPIGVVSGALLEGSLRLVVASFSFVVGKLSSVHAVIDDLVNSAGNFPTSVFGSAATLLTWVVPVAFVAVVPGQVILDQTSVKLVPEWMALTSPVLITAFFCAAYVLFNRMARLYVGGR